MPANGFYEWQTRGTKKQPYKITLRHGALIAFAGLWARWAPEDGDPVETFAIVTTRASKLVSEVHDRIAPSHRFFHAYRVADISPDKRVAGVLRHLLEIGQIARIGQFVVINELVVLARSQNVADEVRADKSRPTGNQNFHRSTRSVASCSSPVRDGLLAPVSATSVFARSSESKVPASVHQPSRTS